MRGLLRSAFAATTALLLCCVILGIAYATGMLAGGHMYAFELPCKLSFPFAVIVGIVAGVISYRRPHDQSALLAAAIGAALGCLYWYLSERVFALRFTDRWQWGFLSLDYELQALSCWVAAGASAMMVAFSRRTKTMLSTAAILCLSAALLPAPVFNSLTDNQELTVAFVTPMTLGADAAARPEAAIDGSKQFDPTPETAHVLEKLRVSGIQGEYRVTNLCRVGTGKKSLQIIVVSAPVQGRELLPEPRSAEVIYVRKPNGWQRIPSEAPVLSRSVEIWEPGTSDDSLATFGIPDASRISLVGRVRSNGAAVSRA